MKKNIFKSLGLALVLSSFSLVTSCQDALDIVQPGEINESVIFTSVDNLEKYLIGDVYTNADPSNEIYFSAVISDEVKPGRGSGGQQYQLHRFFLPTNETYSNNIWSQHYRLINRVNRLIEGAKKITPNANEQEKYNSIIAEARALRAWAYVQLSIFFSKDMKNPNELGVILLNDVPVAEAKLPRVSNSEIYSLIESDLEFAKNNLKNGANEFKVDKNFVNALGARFNLYRGNYPAAKTYADLVLSQSGLSLTEAGTFTTAEVGTEAWNTLFYATANSNSPYRKIWIDQSRGEIISAFQRIGAGPSGNIGTFWNTNSSQLSGNPMWVWGRNLFNIFNTTQGDIRRYTYVDPSALINPNYSSPGADAFNTDVLVVDKYPGKVNFPTKNNIKIFRLSEMYLILAEVAAFNNDFPTAQNYVQKVREARNYLGLAQTPVYGNKAEALKDILKERRVELALEGHRFIDLKRLAVEAGVSMDRNATDDIIPVTNLSNGDYRYTLPVPLNEISANPNAQQNPGY